MNTDKLRYPTLKAAAQAALDVQDACNLSGVAIAFADVMKTLCAFVDNTSDRNNHPIARVWIDKLAHLAGIQALHDPRLIGAYAIVRGLADGSLVDSSDPIIDVLADNTRTR